MTEGDFYGNEQSVIADDATSVCIKHTDASGKETIMMDDIAVKQGEVMDSTFMSAKKL